MHMSLYAYSGVDSYAWTITFMQIGNKVCVLFRKKSARLLLNFFNNLSSTCIQIRLSNIIIEHYFPLHLREYCEY
jgi:hypothetical protein